MIIDDLAVGVVTFNRLELLKKVIKGLKEQTFKPAKIFIINNSSTDGTAEWLENQVGIEVITQENSGSSGGQYTAVKKIYDSGFNWICIIDDDVVPEIDCLENLYKHRDEKEINIPIRIGADGKIYYNDTLKFNLTNPFKGIWKKVLNEKNILGEKILTEGITFEGPFFHRNLVKDIGLPDREFFIYADDTEYCIRAGRAGYTANIILSAKLNRLLFPPENEYLFSWKHYYVLRNIMIVDKLYGNFFVKKLRPLFYTFIWIFRCKSYNDLKTLLKAYRDSITYKQIDLKV